MSPDALARTWLEVFNRHDLDALLALYAEDATHTSPKIRSLYPDSGGQLRGKVALRQWWTEALARLPALHYAEVALTTHPTRAVLEYLRQVPGEIDLWVAESFEIRSGRIVASRVYHG